MWLIVVEMGAVMPRQTSFRHQAKNPAEEGSPLHALLEDPNTRSLELERGDVKISYFRMEA